jgi:type III secretion protein T
MSDYWPLIVAIGLSLPRTMAAFMMLPAFSSSEIIPGLVRNAFFVSTALITMPVILHTGIPVHLNSIQLVTLIAKESLIGLLIGFFYSGIFWVIGSAGNIIDTQAGANTASIVDPFSGYEEQLAGAFLSRMAIWLFAASGGIIIFLGLMLQSYVLWPVTHMLPSLPPSGLSILINQFGQMMVMTLILATPALFIFTLVELGFGLLNRIAPQLNVQVTGTSIKVFMSIGLLWITLTGIIRFVTDHQMSASAVLKTLQSILPSGS